MQQASHSPGRTRPGILSLIFLLLFAAVALAHRTLLHLPYFWDEGGYYVPAALDFFHRWTLIPEFTNAHPPLPSIVLGLAWHVFGFRIFTTRLVACAFAAGGLLAVFELSRRLLGLIPAIVVSALTSVYPIWFAQSSLAHADIFAAAFTLAGLCVFLTAPELRAGPTQIPYPAEDRRRLVCAAGFFCLSVLAKETAVVQPFALALFVVLRLNGQSPPQRQAARRWLLALGSPVLVLVLWFSYHHWKTGFTFGNPDYLRYNATANLTFRHLVTSFGYRAMHLFWQRSIWLPLLLAAACLLLPRRAQQSRGDGLSLPVLACIAVLVLVNWVAFSVLGGALLTRYLLPVYPLLLLVAVDLWHQRTSYWPGLVAITAVAFVSGLWLNPPTYFAPEDNLTYRDMIVVHQEAAAWLEQHAPDATVLTAWPAAAELFRPELGYIKHPFKIVSIENFSPAEIAKAAGEPGKFDTALVFTTRYVTPAFRQYLLTHPNSRRGREARQNRDLSPAEIARALGGHIAWQDDRNGEWAAILQFNRRYDAVASPPYGPAASVAASPGVPSLGNTR